MFKPTVGPIVGHTTTDHARIFLRGDHHNKRVFAGIRHRRQGDAAWSKGQFVQLKAYRDMSDVIVLNGLQASTAYEYQAGWFSPPSPPHTLETVQELPLRWPSETYCLRTPAREAGAPRAYIVGSCRYLRITGGLPSLAGLGDRTFAGINRVVAQANPPISAVLMIGDQVYLDDLNVVAPDRTYKHILFKYRTAFSQPHIRRLMSEVPTYMILDDHEIEDNWPANKTVNDEVLYANAMSAYALYQASHGPAHERLGDGTLNKSLTRYWYPFAHGDVEWFVTDSRTQRNLSAQDRRILDDEQERALLNWLVSSPARVKFVVTSVMFYPDSKRNDGDAWQAFPQQRLRLLETIRSHAIKNVIFVSGDVHGSMTSRLRHSGDPDFEVNTVVSSPFYNSKLLPYAKATDFVFDRPMARTQSGEYVYELTSNVVSQDNFARLDVTAQSVQVTFHNRDGMPLQTVDIPLR
ncbi:MULTISPECIES: alkaline phosphatase D family protein [Pseudomonas]|uniref:alkaline phosphatase D family protein n=1 Tax=Pseudomonas TaxID=286 RepID=UPI001BEACC7D|nr:MULTISPECIES: alkaline phosphatase D family protein [Pseudomonas]MBT2337870.1 alkaline phosphatase family protein [Pseudomonas fluorescens]MCD4528372.1 alkaline phosphatase family protein [Pseudomonas sp. C3-2018]